VVEAPLATFSLAEIHWCARMYHARPWVLVFRMESQVRPQILAFSSSGAGQSIFFEPDAFW
jgi:hypothetical protein